MEKYDVCVVGGGASGMAAAVFMKQQNEAMKILIIEKKEKLGKKIYATGNGRCNISNSMCGTFGDTARFFRTIGVEITTDEKGRAYPVSQQAADVANALENALEAYGVRVILNSTVENIKKTDGVFQIKTDKEIHLADKVLMATGGKAAPQYGTSGDGYVMARKLGHKINKTAPALVCIRCKSDVLKENKGIRAKAKVSLFRHGHFVEEEIGEVQFTKDGLSGICIFNLSNYIRLGENTDFSDYTLNLDLLPEYKDVEIYHILSERRNIKQFRVNKLMNSIVNSRLAEQILKPWSSKREFVSELTEGELKDIVKAFKNVLFYVIKSGGWKEAQCTAGGVSFDDFNRETMESNKCFGLYFTGEMIDYVGPCGGFNLENAWNTARKAGKAICTEYMK